MFVCSSDVVAVSWHCPTSFFKQITCRNRETALAKSASGIDIRLVNCRNHLKRLLNDVGIGVEKSIRSPVMGCVKHNM